MTSDKINNNQLTKFVSLFFTLLLTVVFLFIAFRNVDLKKSLQLISQTSLVGVLFYLVVFFISHFARAIRWKYMLLSIKKDVSLNHLFGSVMVSYGVSCIIPRAGEIYRALFLGKWENISRSTVLGTIVVERIIDITIFAFASLVSVSLYTGNLYKEITWLKTSLIIGFAFIFFTIVFLIILIQNQERFRKWIIFFSNKISPKLANKLNMLFDTLIEGFSSIKKSKHFIAVILWSFIIIFLYALNTYVGFYMFDMHDQKDINFISAWIFMTISSFGVLIPTPGGTGSYHAIAIFVLTRIYHFSYDVGAAYAILTHFLSYFAFVTSTLLIIYFFNRQRNNKGLPKENFISVFKD
ncbi:lysylphosphatidylglycerol synthase transmembrane domain-containing protein [Stygiobacter electus]|uniref:Lysylphosphatidylglycerol synthase transmembrane domain-containing protein n=1 Tax=Stygiobacter electus TaxID=3032292 RepID=A0AAE3TB01_9BACT|nr:lysylphosphatidylglycerol synthase transmembrane domain-containing protein [Stygiobacter electus]MDF1610798.1 lysylphosphatidylglycerol synthase transmembrane domain-containing protein [Stygiobacter electus]